MTTHPFDLRPLHQTTEAIALLQAYAETDLLVQLCDQAAAVRHVVPDLIAMSVTTVNPHLTLTLLVTRERMASLRHFGVSRALNALDAATTTTVAIAGFTATATGPTPFEEAVATRDLEHPNIGERGRLSEECWSHGARAVNADGIGATLTTPTVVAGEIIGHVDLYAHHRDAFDGLHHELAAVCGTWAPGAVRNADLSFATIHAARQAPAVLRDDAVVSIAIGLIAARGRTSIPHARARLLETASTLRVHPARLADLITATAADGTCA